MTLDVAGLSVHYGRALALHDVSFTVPTGSAIAVLGHNGAGKSSLMRALGGLLSPSKGTVTWDQRRLPKLAFRAARGLRLVPEGGNVFSELSVEDNLRAGMLGLPRAERQDRVEWILSEFALLERLRRQQAGRLSGGQRQSLAVARAIIARPRLLLLDEPTLGLSPKAAGALFETLARLTADLHMTVLLAEQNVGLALEVCDGGWWLDAGELVAKVIRDPVSGSVTRVPIVA
jgi:branched-chain amino acid transport system ATP-binding protein